MDDEKNGIENPENVEASEESKEVDQAPPEEGGAESSSDVPSDELAPDEVASGTDDQVEDESADEIKADAAGGDTYLSQDEINNVLGDMVGDSKASNPNAGILDDSLLDEADVKQADFQQLSQSGDEGEPRNIELLMDVDLPVSIELGKTKMNISDILSLGPGSIVELDKLVGEPVDLLVNRKCVARGEVVVVEESFGLRITQLVSTEERLKNLQ